MINVHNITLLRNKKALLQDISLYVKKGQIVGIVGRNGAGKSLLLKSILGLEKITNGDIILGSDKIAYMPQSIFISPLLPITVADFIHLFVKKITDNSLLETLNIYSLLNMPLNTLSGGELQKVLFASTMMQNADIIIMDEPEQNLDITSKIIMFEQIKKYSQNSAILMVSHDIGMVFNQINHLICLDKRIHCQGKPGEIDMRELATIFPQDIISKFLGKYH